MANKEKEIELKVKQEKISEEDLKELQTLINKLNSTQYNIGRIESEKHTALHNLAEIKDQVPIFQDKLMKKYGHYDVNLNDGTINWPEEPSENGVDKPKEDEK